MPMIYLGKFLATFALENNGIQMLSKCYQSAVSKMRLSSSTHSKVTLRKHFRNARNRLSETKQSLAASRLAVNFSKVVNTRSIRSIAAYIADDGEINPIKLCQLLQRQGVRVHIPTIEAQHLPLSFSCLPSSKLLLKLGMFNIPVALNRRKINASKLDILLVPLVAFDRHFNRLGRGGGYYDRTLEQVRANSSCKVAAMGIAHQQQSYSGKLLIESSDQALDSVCTDLGFMSKTKPARVLTCRGFKKGVKKICIMTGVKSYQLCL